MSYSEIFDGLFMLGLLAFFVFVTVREKQAGQRMEEAHQLLLKAEEKMRTVRGAATSVFDTIQNANPDRHYNNLARRLLKIGEEYGETSEAYLNVTSSNNSKKKKWKDVREELVDTIIVAIDCALTPFPGNLFTDEEIKQELFDLITLKLAKWADNRSTAATNEDDV